MSSVSKVCPLLRILRFVLLFSREYVGVLFMVVKMKFITLLTILDMRMESEIGITINSSRHRRIPSSQILTLFVIVVAATVVEVGVSQCGGECRSHLYELIIMFL